MSLFLLQWLASDRRELKAPSSSNRKRQLEMNVQNWEGDIMNYKEGLEKTGRALSKEREALEVLLRFSPGK